MTTTSDPAPGDDESRESAPTDPTADADAGTDAADTDTAVDAHADASAIAANTDTDAQSGVAHAGDADADASAPIDVDTESTENTPSVDHGLPTDDTPPAGDARPHDAPPSHDAPPAAGPYTATGTGTGTGSSSARSGTRSSASATADRLFAWVSGLGVVRSEGWLGGVSAGVAARLRIDPLIVRGVLVVAALFGLPVIFLYALAWALLPDVEGRIHARDLVRGDYQPVQWGILATAVIGLVPTAPLTGAVFGLGYGGWSAFSLFTWIAALSIVGILIFLIVRAASRTPGVSASDLPMASADPTAPGAPVTLDDSGSSEGAGATWAPGATASSGAARTAIYAPPSPTAVLTVPAAPPRPEPPASPVTDSPESLALWKEQHAAWKEQDQAWRRQQQDAERAVRDQLRRERQAEATVFAAEAAERRRVRRQSNPRASFAYVASVGGLAIVIGAGVALWSGLGASAGAVGVLSAALVLALGMIVAGAWRRRSGFLAFLAAATLVIGLIAGAASSMPWTVLGSVSIQNDRAVTLVQPFGELDVSLSVHSDRPVPISVDKATGVTYITVHPGIELDLAATLGNGSVTWTRLSENGEYLDGGSLSGSTGTRGSLSIDEKLAAENGEIDTVQPVSITQNSGDIQITMIEPTEDER